MLPRLLRFLRLPVRQQPPQTSAQFLQPTVPKSSAIFCKHFLAIPYPVVLHFHCRLYLVYLGYFLSLPQKFFILNANDFSIQIENPLSTYHHHSETPYSSHLQNGDRLSTTYHLIYHLSPPRQRQCRHTNQSPRANRSINRGQLQFQGRKP